MRKGFGFFVLAMGVFVLVQELPSPAGAIVGVLGSGMVAAVLLCEDCACAGSAWTPA